MIEVIEFKEGVYPKFQSEGFASQFAFPFAQKVCKGVGFDIGCNRELWQFPGSFPVDPIINGFDAMDLPSIELVKRIYDKEIHPSGVDYIFSSHCLEHIPDWVSVLNYWKTKLRSGGVLFLYLPHPDQEYWLPWNNRKHVNILYPQDIEKYLKDNGFKSVFVSGKDLNCSYMAMAEKI